MEPPLFLPSDVSADGLVPLTSRCRNGDRQLLGGFFGGMGSGPRPSEVSVESAPDTAWQVVIFDPAPR